MKLQFQSISASLAEKSILKFHQFISINFLLFIYCSNQKHFIKKVVTWYCIPIFFIPKKIKFGRYQKKIRQDFEKFKKFIVPFDLSDADFDLLIEHCESVEFREEEHILIASVKQSWIYFIHMGIIRNYYFYYKKLINSLFYTYLMKLKRIFYPYRINTY
jgi:hypothetical protein